VEKPIQLVQYDVGKERRYHTTLGNPFGGRMDGAIDFYSRPQKARNEIEELVVHHFPSEAPKDRFVRNLIKTRLDVALDDPGKSLERRLTALGYRMVRIPVGPKPVGVLMELDLENGFQRHTYCLLDDLVPQAGHGQR
jgi:hypothetical protein